jgi:hypothetical protein
VFALFLVQGGKIKIKNEITLRLASLQASLALSGEVNEMG